MMNAVEQVQQAIKAAIAAGSRKSRPSRSWHRVKYSS